MNLKQGLAGMMLATAGTAVAAEPEITIDEVLAGEADRGCIFLQREYWNAVKATAEEMGVGIGDKKAHLSDKARFIVDTALSDGCPTREHNWGGRNTVHFLPIPSK